jgi:serine/threonine protein kinase
LIDFGLSTIIDHSPPCTGGTPWYVAPEFLAGERCAPADVWALGVVMMYTLRCFPLPDKGLQVRSWIIKDVHRPLDGREIASNAQKWMKTVEENRQGLDWKNDWLQAFVFDMLEGHPGRRIQPSEMVERLGRSHS